MGMLTAVPYCSLIMEALKLRAEQKIALQLMIDNVDTMTPFDS